MTKSLFAAGKLIIYTDGGARGNPGPAAIGVVIGSKEYGEYLGRTTNNYAEYRAVVFALKKIKQLVGKAKSKSIEVEVRMDSELVVKQLSGTYKILEPELQPLFVEIWNLRFDFKKLEFVHVPRGENRRADIIMNRVLDEHF